MAKLKHLGTTATNKNYIHEGIKSRLNPENASCHSVQVVLSSCLLFKRFKD
jgi:hypothetical protein